MWLNFPIPSEASVAEIWCFYAFTPILPWNVKEPSPDGLMDEPGNGESPVLVMPRTSPEKMGEF